MTYKPRKRVNCYRWNGDVPCIERKVSRNQFQDWKICIMPGVKNEENRPSFYKNYIKCESRLKFRMNKEKSGSNRCSLSKMIDISHGAMPIMRLLKWYDRCKKGGHYHINSWRFWYPDGIRKFELELVSTTGWSVWNMPKALFN